jgi:hypothetical protein
VYSVLVVAGGWRAECGSVLVGPDRAGLGVLFLGFWCVGASYGYGDVSGGLHGGGDAV